MRTPLLAIAAVVALGVHAPSAWLQSRGGGSGIHGGEDETGPYDLARSWPAPFARAGYMWGSVGPERRERTRSRDGKLLWKVPFTLQLALTIATPVRTGAYLFVATHRSGGARRAWSRTGASRRTPTST